MKLPAVAIAAVFICGILVGRHPLVAIHALSHVFLVLGFTVWGCLLCAGMLLTQVQRLALGAAASILSWLVFGIPQHGHLAAAAASRPRVDVDRPGSHPVALAVTMAWRPA
jgi:hypothetical protein